MKRNLLLLVSKSGRVNQPDRRHVLKALGVASLTGLAGCTGGEDDGSTTEQSDSDDEDESEPSETDASGVTLTETLTPGSQSENGVTATEPSDTSQTDSNSLSEQEKIAAGDGESGDNFGSVLAVSDDGSTAIVGAPWDDNENGDIAGAVYVFTRASGSWEQKQKVTADTGSARDFFGSALALSADGSTAIIGARSDDNSNGQSAGAAYVFSRQQGFFIQQAELTAADGERQEYFGTAIDISANGSTAIIGSGNDSNENGYNAGAAYVFSRSGDSWSQQAKLIADDGDEQDYFGREVALAADGSIAIVGNPNDKPNGNNTGSAYVFSVSSGTWNQETKLIANDGEAEDYFGDAVAVSSDGKVVFIGAASDENANGDSAGSTYVFTQSNGSWSQQTTLTAEDGDNSDAFGSSIALSSDAETAIISASGDDDPNGDSAGSTYVFARSDESWRQQTKLAADDGDESDLFGWSVALSGNGETLLIGASRDEDPNGEEAGAGYVFE